MKILPINVGYSRIKSLNGEIFKSRRREIILQSEDSSIKELGIGRDCDLLELNNNIYVIGEGFPKTDYVKTDDNFLLTCVLNMCARFTPKSNETFKLILSSPPLTFYNSEEEFPGYFIGEHKLIHNNSEKTITISEIEVYPETFVAYLANNPSDYETHDLIIIDIGGETTNICFINKSNFKVTPEYFDTSRTGMYHLDTKIADYLKNKYIKYNLEVNSDKAEEYRLHGLYLNGDFDKDLMITDDKEEIDKIYKKHVNTCINVIDRKNWNLNNCKVLITGGGGEAMFHVFKKSIPHCQLGKNPLFDTLNGLKELC
jgi:StbA protein.